MYTKRIIPCLDVKGGRVVKGTNFVGLRDAGDPVELAHRYDLERCDELVFLDITASNEQRDTIVQVARDCASQVFIPFTIGGGIRTMENIDEVLSLGVQRVILGSVAVKNPALVKEACQKYGDRVVVGIDAKDGIVAVDGWGVSGDVEVTVLAKEMAKAGVKTIIYTDISRDGTLSGVNVEATARLARESGIKVVASGGVKSLDDIKALLPYEKDGIEGVIVGKSIYTGSLDLQEAVALVESAGTGEA